MARINKQSFIQDKPVKKLHSEVKAKFRLVDNDDGEKYIQVDTYGKEGRQYDKVSQVLQLDSETLTFLLDTLNKYKSTIINTNDALIKKILNLTLDTNGGVKLYQPCLLLAIIELNKQVQQKSELRDVYRTVCKKYGVRTDTAFENPYNALIGKGILNINFDTETNLSDEDWKYIQKNHGDLKQYVLDKWFKEKEEVIEQVNLDSNFSKYFQRSCEDQSLKLTNQLSHNFISALMTKPFIILTGLSGSGKTQIARAFSKWLSVSEELQIKVVAVGADWTSNENLLGYPDALNPGRYRKPDNGVLDLILGAQQNPNMPYFLILDEMNLSHVERYFADFLSAIESNEAIQLHDDTGTDWYCSDQKFLVPSKLYIPKNLFVIGTVNVDETTYMFSPKVLDRANVLEFRVKEQDITNFLDNPKKPNVEMISGLGAKYARNFVIQATNKDCELNEVEKIEVNKLLKSTFPKLQECGAEFGYRTAHEFCRFIYFHQKLSPSPDLDEAIDAAIMQKLLPKLHGSRKKLGPVLEQLLQCCLLIEGQLGSYRFIESAEKIVRMQKCLIRNGFTSFAEA